MSSSSSSRSSTSPEPEMSNPHKSRSKQDKGKKKALSNDLKNEGTDPNWDFKPPPGRVLLEDQDDDAGEFDWDAINADDDVDLWLIRVPDAVKPKYLDGLKLNSAPSSSKSVKVGSLKKKHATFDIWSMGSATQDDEPIGGEEIRSLSCLLPRKKKKGKLYSAPKPIARHIVFSVPPVVPTEVSSDTTLPEKDSTTGRYKNPPRPSYPAELLTHRFEPYGAYTTSLTVTTTTDDSVMDLDDDTQPPPPAQKPAKTDKKEGKKEKSKGKKRKGGADGGDEQTEPATKKKKTKTSS